jgi:hypothetical protein
MLFAQDCPQTPSNAALPNFFIVGAPKAGTTSLYYYLDQHPDICMSPIKEPNYFASEIRPENFSPEFREWVGHDTRSLQQYLAGPMLDKRFGGIVSDWKEYLRLFNKAGGKRAIGEASVCYLWSTSAAQNIRRAIAEAKIIMILRDPAERAFSQYLQAVAGGWVRKSFHDQITGSSLSETKKFQVFYPFLEFGLYYQQVKRYLDVFPRENVRIYLYEQYREQPSDTFADICRFLHVDPDFLPDMRQRHLEHRIPKYITLSYFLKKYGVWKGLGRYSPDAIRPALRKMVLRQTRSVVLDPADREFLCAYYKDNIQQLSRLLNRDLNNWLR